MSSLFGPRRPATTTQGRLVLRRPDGQGRFPDFAIQFGLAPQLDAQGGLAR